MDKVEILRKAVMKAKKQGYFLGIDIDTLLTGGDDVICFNDTIASRNYVKGSFCYYKIIYNHRFAEALWGKDWTTHLQNMVVLRDPLEYLVKFIDEEKLVAS